MGPYTHIPAAGTLVLLPVCAWGTQSYDPQLQTVYLWYHNNQDKQLGLDCMRIWTHRVKMIHAVGVGCAGEGERESLLEELRSVL